MARSDFGLVKRVIVEIPPDLLPEIGETIYASIPLYKGYFAGSDGTVWSKWTRNTGGRKGRSEIDDKEWHQLTKVFRSYGLDCKHSYPFVYIRGDLDRKTGRRDHPVPLHILVASAFLGERPKGFHTCHKDDEPGHSCIYNLYYGTAKQNSEDQKKNRDKKRIIICPYCEYTNG